MTVRIYRPAAMSTTCGEFDRNPAYGDDPGAPLLLHCQAGATYRITIRDSVFTSVKLCCGYHAAELRHKARRGRMEILSDEPID